MNGTLLEALRQVRNIHRNRRNFCRNRRNIRRNRRGSRNLVHSSTVGAQHSPHSPRVVEPCWKLYGRCATFAAIAATFAAIAAGRGPLFIALRWVPNILRIRHGSWNHVGSSTMGVQHSPQSVQLSPQHSPQSPRVAEPCS